MIKRGFPGNSADKESAYSAGNPGSIPGSGRSPREGRHNPLQYSCLDNPPGQRSVAGYSPWDCKELDTIERLSIAQQSDQKYEYRNHGTIMTGIYEEILCII